MPRRRKIVRETLALERRLLGDDHPQTITGNRPSRERDAVGGSRYSDEEALERERWSVSGASKALITPRHLARFWTLAGTFRTWAGQTRLSDRFATRSTRPVEASEKPNTTSMAAAAMIDLANHLRRKGTTQGRSRCSGKWLPSIRAPWDLKATPRCSR